ncbi:hypothetical protein QBC34DRAFT_204952 [Podospora aff. communis PSN243]|uniref:Uncharacterized protein n=1 Tax=Podospora aff. communis PSN243 TaxID=3040156 RepID=A0AAV9GWR7_9PEZI|nr:hypothetical protein QBC34DRAFT_204952 [Podospora aff. communis PSN243]
MCIRRSSGHTCRTSGRLRSFPSKARFPSSRPQTSSERFRLSTRPVAYRLRHPTPASKRRAFGRRCRKFAAPIFYDVVPQTPYQSFPIPPWWPSFWVDASFRKCLPPATRSRSVPADGSECEWPGQRCLTPDVVFCSCLLLLSLMLLGVDPGGRGLRIAWCFGAVWLPPPMPDRPRGCEPVPRGPWTFDLGGAAPAALRRRRRMRRRGMRRSSSSKREREARRD